MNTTRWALGFTLIASLLPSTFPFAGAQDTVQVNADSVRLKLENDRVRVLEIRLKPGAKEQLHSHQWPYIVYVITGGTIRTHLPDGTVNETKLEAGDAIYREPVTHWGENIGTTEVYEVLVELKKQD